MSRPLRIEFPGALYHVTSRGNERQPIYRGGRDRATFLELLGEVVADHRWICHAYCLMENHYHLLLQTPEANLSRGMRQLNGIYAQRFNHRHERVGHLFQGRYAGILVERESHLFELARYVVLNPVRAGVVLEPEDYRWSSLRATLGLARMPPWLSIEPLLRRFGSRQRYRAFVHEGVAARAPWADLRGTLLGSEGFTRTVGRGLKKRAGRPGMTRRERVAHEESLDRLFPPRVVQDRFARDGRIRQVSRTTAYALSDIARHLGLHRSTVTRIAAGRR